MIFIRLNQNLEIKSIEDNSDINYSPLIGKSFFSLFISRARKDENKIYRWLNDPTSKLSFTGILNIANHPFEYTIAFAMLKEDIAVTLENLTLNIGASNFVNFSSRFWPIFSQTFEGGFLFLDKENRILEISQAAIDMLILRNPNSVNVSRTSVLFRHLENYLHTYQGREIYQCIMNLQKESLKDGATKKHENYSYNCHYLNISLGPVYKYGQLIGYCVYIFDVTEIVIRDEKIKSQQALLINSSKMVALGEMAGGIAHEINNPLTIISANLSLMKRLFTAEKLKQEEFEKITAAMNKTLDRITKIIKGLRVISRDANDESFLPITVKEIIEDVFGLCQEKFKTGHITLTIDDPQNILETTIYCRSVQISQVLLNLLNNSFDAISNQDEKWIKIYLSSDIDNIKIEIVDSGKGISTDLQAKIFQPFFTTKDVGKGTGLGLSLSYSIINDHKGKFFIDNHNPNTAFIIELPVNLNHGTVLN